MSIDEEVEAVMRNTSRRNDEYSDTSVDEGEEVAMRKISKV